MEHLKKFTNFINENIIVSQKAYQDGHFGREFDEWKKQCGQKAEENGWNDWDFVFYNQSSSVSIPNHQGDKLPSNTILFLVNEKGGSGESPNTRKGTFDLKTKKGTLV